MTEYYFNKYNTNKIIKLYGDNDITKEEKYNIIELDIIKKKLKLEYDIKEIKNRSEIKEKGYYLLNNKIFKKDEKITIMGVILIYEKMKEEDEEEIILNNETYIKIQIFIEEKEEEKEEVININNTKIINVMIKKKKNNNIINNLKRYLKKNKVTVEDNIVKDENEKKIGYIYDIYMLKTGSIIHNINTIKNAIDNENILNNSVICAYLNILNNNHVNVLLKKEERIMIIKEICDIAIIRVKNEKKSCIGFIKIFKEKIKELIKDIKKIEVEQKINFKFDMEGYLKELEE